MIKSLIFIALIAYAHSQAKVMPVLIVPGLGDSCGNVLSMARVIKEMQAQVPNKIHCVDSGPGMQSELGNFQKQIDRACKITSDNADSWGVKDGFIAMGLSQGGLIARAIIEECPVGVYAKRLITLGGTHQGVAQIPHTGQSWWENIINKIADMAVYNSFVQNLIGPVGYFHRIDDEKSYFNSGIPLARLNNVGPTKNAEYNKRMANLEVISLVMFSQDTMIVPKETAQFGFYADSSKKTITKLADSDVIKSDLIGLKALSDAGKIHYHEINGDHLQFGMDDLKRVAFPYFQ